MLRVFRCSALRLPALMLAALLTQGCFAYSNRGSDIDRTPVVDTGVGARVIYPGQTVAMPGSPGPASQQQAGAPQPQAGAPAPEPGAGDTVTPGSGSITFIGGAAVDEKKSVRIKESPIYHKYLTLPLALAAAPFAAAAKALRGEEEAGPEIPARPHQQAPPPPPSASASPRAVDYEQAKLEAMERELAQRGNLAPPPTPPAPAGGTSIADELAALQRQPVTAPEATPAPAPAPVQTARLDPGLVTADGIVDRDGDGRVDQWIFRQDGQIVRSLFDQDGDGRPDRTLHYDPATHRIARVEEDSDLDGAVDSWTDYRDGQVVRRRADADQDGLVDSWSYFRGDEIQRHESDTTGDGFRDRVRFYRDGMVSREEQDNDGDGQAELTLHFDAASQVVRRDEDQDGDGEIDVISHYEDGRLVRRELLDAAEGR